MEFKKLDEFVVMARDGKKKRLVVAAAADETVLEAVYNAYKEDIIEPILVGDREAIHQICTNLNIRFGDVEIVQETDPAEAAKVSVSLIRQGRGDILMKGMVSSDLFLKPIVNKENGLRKGSLISHITFVENPFYHKILAISDVAVNISPTFDDKIAIIENSVDAFHKLGVECPKIAVVSAIETVNPKVESTIHAAMLTMMNRRNQIKGCLIDGPLALDNAVSKEAAKHKGIISDVAGDADLILCPEIVSGNIFYKSMVFLGNSCVAAVVLGAQVPIILTSRADSDKSKMMSIAVAAAMK
jgi:phosphate butyryltransferase